MLSQVVKWHAFSSAFSHGDVTRSESSQLGLFLHLAGENVCIFPGGQVMVVVEWWHSRRRWELLVLTACRAAAEVVLLR